MAKDNTVKLGEHILQMRPEREQFSYARARVEILERLDGSLVVRHRRQVIATTELPPHPVTLRAHKKGPQVYWHH